MESLFIGILSSIVASCSFLIFLSLLRPKMAISPEIAMREENGKRKYVIKVINSGWRDAVNIKAEISIVKTKIVPDGSIDSTKTLTIKKNEIFILERMDEKCDEANYAYRFVSYDDIDGMWTDEDAEIIRFKLYAQDGMSNFGRVFSKDYRTKRNSLKKEEFRFGNSLDIA